MPAAPAVPAKILTPEQRSRIFASGPCLISVSLGLLDNEIHHAHHVSGRERIMRAALLNDHGGLATKLFVSLLDHARVLVEPRVRAVTQMQQRHAGFGERGEVFQRWRL